MRGSDITDYISDVSAHDMKKMEDSGDSSRKRRMIDDDDQRDVINTIGDEIMQLRFVRDLQEDCVEAISSVFRQKRIKLYDALENSVGTEDAIAQKIAALYSEYGNDIFRMAMEKYHEGHLDGDSDEDDDDVSDSASEDSSMSMEDECDYSSDSSEDPDDNEEIERLYNLACVTCSDNIVLKEILDYIWEQRNYKNSDHDILKILENLSNGIISHLYGGTIIYDAVNYLVREYEDIIEDMKAGEYETIEEYNDDCGYLGELRARLAAYYDYIKGIQADDSILQEIRRILDDETLAPLPIYDTKETVFQEHREERKYLINMLYYDQGIELDLDEAETMHIETLREMAESVSDGDEDEDTGREPNFDELFDCSPEDADDMIEILEEGYPGFRLFLQKTDINIESLLRKGSYEEQERAAGIINEWINEQKSNTDDKQDPEDILLNQEIARTDLILPQKKFANLCEEIMQDFRVDTRFDDEALEALQTAAEEYLIQTFSRAAKLARYRYDSVVEPRDLHLAVSL